MPDTPDIRPRSGVTSFVSISNYCILPFPAQSNKAVTMNLTRNPKREMIQIFDTPKVSMLMSAKLLGF